MSNGTQRNASELKDIVFVEWNGTRWIIKCPYFIPTDDKTVYKCLTINQTTDKIKCGKHKRKTRDYMYHSAYRCWNCALRHKRATRVTHSNSDLQIAESKRSDDTPQNTSWVRTEG